MPYYTHRFSSRLKILNGPEFVGTILPVSDYDSNVDKLYLPRQLLRTPPHTNVKPGNIIIAPGGTKFLVAESKTDFLNNVIEHKTFRLYKITHYTQWLRNQKVIDPLTSLEKIVNETIMGMIYVAIEPVKYQDLDQKLRIEQTTYNIFSGAPIMVNDKIAGYRVIRVMNLMGITVGEAQ